MRKSTEKYILVHTRKNNPFMETTGYTQNTLTNIPSLGDPVYMNHRGKAQKLVEPHDVEAGSISAMIHH